MEIVDRPKSPRPRPRTGVAAPSLLSLTRAESVLPEAVRRQARSLNSALDRLACQVVLFRTRGLVFVTFGLFAAAGALVSLTGAGALLVGQGFAPREFALLALAGSAAVVTGSWLLGQMLDYRFLLRDPRAALQRPVFVSWGGLFGPLATLAAFSAWTGTAPAVLLDALACTVPLGHALGRLGCISYGCCFGRPTNGPLAVTYHHPAAKAVRVGRLHGVRLHPAPFYEAILDIGILLIVNVTRIGGAPLGVPVALTLILYGFGRFAIEYLRNNDGRMVCRGLALNQIVSLALAAVGFMALRASHLGGQTAPPVHWHASLAAWPWLAASVLPATLLVFLGFALHRRRVGEW